MVIAYQKINGQSEYREATAEEVESIESQRIAEIESAKPKLITTFVETKNGSVMIETNTDFSVALSNEIALKAWAHERRLIRVFMKNTDYIAMLKIAPELAVMVRDLAIPTEQFDGGEFIYLEYLLPEHKALMLSFNAVIETKQP